MHGRTVVAKQDKTCIDLERNLDAQSLRSVIEGLQCEYAMLPVTSRTRVYLYLHPSHMRNRSRLYSLIHSDLGKNALSGPLFVLYSHCHNMMKLV